MDHPTFTALLELERITDPDAIIAQRRKIVHRLGSGATRLVTVEHITPQGVQVLNENLADPTLGTVRTRIDADRPFELRGLQHSAQWTELGFSFLQHGGISVVLGGSVPFDEVMKQDTEEEWQQWGFDLIYRVDDKGGTFAFRPQANYPALITARLASFE